MGGMLARTALVCRIAGLPLLLLSYTWLPLAWMGREAEFVRYAVVVGEVGALAAGALAVGLGLVARRSSSRGQREHRLASRGLVIGAVVLVSVLVPNIIGSLLTVR